jgi:phospholipid/cholesterol/gamma-HCH transport system substrate-binding protein
VGASDILLKGSLYSVYFDESVQGLQVDSAIKYRGVEIGKVQSIKVAPDYRLIEVVMKIDLEGDLQNHTIATLKTAGITGIVFIELDQIGPVIWIMYQR